MNIKLTWLLACSLDCDFLGIRDDFVRFAPALVPTYVFQAFRVYTVAWFGIVQVEPVELIFLTVNICRES